MLVPSCWNCKRWSLLSVSVIYFRRRWGARLTMRFRSAPVSLFCVVATCLVHIAAGFRMSSGYNSAKVEAVVYTGSSTTLTWTLHHDLCNNAGVQTPGSSIYQDQYCAYSSSDNFIVTSSCNWGSQSFSYVDGSLNGGHGYMTTVTLLRTCPKVSPVVLIELVHPDDTADGIP
ncbi:hypothetical protein CYMTET_44221 [Cymbomonas tetramitiformis]|uniref:Uncharacterized protein n=1 Tax=Cymbomonas tetramitiformis TaxID=36881 RepID=A0AAE0C2Q8_9CHLO|nr:hypothetical protein CYMTET_44221 [Cymbomonas tetramitiformis]